MNVCIHSSRCLSERSKNPTTIIYCIKQELYREMTTNDLFRSFTLTEVSAPFNISAHSPWSPFFVVVLLLGCLCQLQLLLIPPVHLLWHWNACCWLFLSKDVISLGCNQFSFIQLFFSVHPVDIFWMLVVDCFCLCL